jgi:hypothetical protein
MSSTSSRKGSGSASIIRRSSSSTKLSAFGLIVHFHLLVPRSADQIGHLIWRDAIPFGEVADFGILFFRTDAVSVVKGAFPPGVGYVRLKPI